jgi:phytoene desaturase
MKKRIAVIGSGFGGLATASRLLSRGHDVTIYEKLDKPGGRAYVFEINGFRFDAGPTVITAPFLFDELFEAAEQKRSDYIEFVPCQPFYRIFGHQGEQFDYNADLDFTLNQINKINPADKAGYVKFIESTKPIFDKGFTELADKPFLSVMDMVRVIPDLIKLKSHQSVYKYVSKFIKNEFLRRCFSFHPLLVGGNPFDTTSIYSMIHYLEREWGVHYAMGGTAALVDALVRLIQYQGGSIQYNSEVSEIVVENGKAKGLKLKDGTSQDYDIIVSNADVAFTYKELIARAHRPTYSDRKIERLHYSMSLFVIYFGTKKRYTDSHLAHHNILLGNRYKGLLSDIFHSKELAEDFSLYLHMPTLTDSSIAPEGSEAFYVLSPVPHLDSETDWEREAPLYRDKILSYLEKHHLPDLRKNIVALHHIDPRYFKDTLNSYKGSAFSVEPLLSQSAWFRPHNRSEDIENLYFVGAGTHPGAGLPGVLSSAKIAESLIGS